MNIARPLFLALAFCGAARAATPDDFRSGLDLQAAGKPLGELDLPDAVYQGVTRADLGDMAVFNSSGTPVPYALCAPPAPEAAAAAEVELRVFPLQQARPGQAGGTHVEVGSRGAVSVDVRPGASPGSETSGIAPTEVAAYVIDTRAPGHPQGQPLGSLRVRWHAPDGVSELHVRVEDSDDLDQWHVLVPQAALVQADHDGASLQRERIPLPSGNRSYLRITRNDPGPAPVLDRVLGSPLPPAAQLAPAQWFEPARLPQGADGFGYDAARLAPVTTARIALPAPNMNLQLSLQSRARADGGWRTVWSGPVFSVGSGAEERHSNDPRFAADSDRYWRVQVTQGADSLAGAAPGLRLGYRPARLRFLAQGNGPFLLAYGSGRTATPAPRSCDSLLQGLPQTDLQSLIGAAQAGSAHALGGDAALQPAPKPVPLRQFLLWAVLLLGAGAVAWMAASLIRSLRR
jgi:hypothetical protein